MSARGECAHMVGSPVMNYMDKGLSVHRGHKYGVTDVTCPTRWWVKQFMLRAQRHEAGAT